MVQFLAAWATAVTQMRGLAIAFGAEATRFVEGERCAAVVGFAG